MLNGLVPKFERFSIIYGGQMHITKVATLVADILVIQPRKYKIQI